VELLEVVVTSGGTGACPASGAAAVEARMGSAAEDTSIQGKNKEREIMGRIDADRRGVRNTHRK